MPPAFTVEIYASFLKTLLWDTIGSVDLIRVKVRRSVLSGQNNTDNEIII